MAKDRTNKSTAKSTQAARTDDDNDKEDPKATFIRLGEKRVTKALNALKNVKNVARYPHTPGQSVKIMGVLQAAMDDIERSFSGETEGKATAIDLSE